MHMHACMHECMGQTNNVYDYLIPFLDYCFVSDGVGGQKSVDDNVSSRTHLLISFRGLRRGQPWDSMFTAYF